MKNKVLNGVLNSLFIILGNFIYALGFSVFVYENQISPGGVTGIATLVNYYISVLPIGILILIFNIPLFILGFIKFKIGFVLKSLLSTVLSSVFIDMLSLKFFHYNGDRILAALAGGILCGCGLAIVMHRGSTTGGTDIIAMLINLKYPFFSVGKAILVVDALIVVIAALIYKNFETVLYSILFIFISSRAVDYVLYGSDKGKLIFIMSSKSDIITKKINEYIGRGVTELKSIGGYTGKEVKTLMCAAKVQDIYKIERVIKSVDDNAFVIITEASKIVGNGFKELK